MVSLEKITAEAAGLSSALIANELRRLDRAGIQLHSFLIMRGGRLVCEAYWKPYDRDTLHRMYSATKSFVSVVIGTLIESGRLSLTDHIVDYFPQYVEGEVHPYLASCTIGDMLRMASCHSRTAYKHGSPDNCIAHFSDNWVKSFFTVKPDHAPGSFFIYDTSATQVLTALAEKLTGRPIIESLHELFELDERSYVITEPAGVSAGGSGLVTRPVDLLCAAGRIMEKARIEGSYLHAAVSKQIDNWASSALPELSNGYGYQFWRLSHNAYAMYGLGSQFAIMVPDKDLVFVTTADTQGKGNAELEIFSSIWHITESAADMAFAPDDEGEEALEAACSSLSLDSLSSEVKGEIPAEEFSFPDGRRIRIVLSSEEGVLEYTDSSGSYSIPFGLNHNIITEIPMAKSSPAASSAAFTGESSILINVQFLGSELGSLKVEAAYHDGHLSVNMKLLGELSFTGWSGVMTSL